MVIRNPSRFSYTFHQRRFYEKHTFESYSGYIFNIIVLSCNILFFGRGTGGQAGKLVLGHVIKAEVMGVVPKSYKEVAEAISDILTRCARRSKGKPVSGKPVSGKPVSGADASGWGR